MKAVGLFVAGALCGAAVMAIPKLVGHFHKETHATLAGRNAASGSRLHTEEQFEFTANGPMEQVAPLFGADKERVWAAGWDPQFVFPNPGTDKEGMVFTIDHHHRRALWVNTELDLKNGRVQYVYVVPDTMATRIALRLTPAGDKTHVAVTYERTALSSDADEHVRQMADGDRGSGPDWEKAVNSYLEKTRR